MPKILLVEDDKSLAETIAESLEREGHKVSALGDGAEGLEHLLWSGYDLAVLDWQLPNLTGVDITRTYRSKGGQIPILMLTGMSSIENKEAGFDSGADDYLTKPFLMRELVARVKVLLRRPATLAEEVWQIGAFTIDTRSRSVKKDGNEIHLQPIEFSLLEFFLKNSNQTLSPDTLLRRVWSTESDATVDSVYTCINRLRRKLDQSNKEALIRTVRGAGYKLLPPDS